MEKTITMQRNKLNNFGLPFAGSLKKLLLALLLMGLSAGLQSLHAQGEKPRFIVEPDNFPLEVDALNRAIETYGDEVIYVLRNGKTYFNEKIMEYNHFLQIEAEEYPSNNPPIIRPATNLQGTGRNISNYRNSILMKGIFFYALDDLGSLRQNQRSAAQDAHLHYQHCYFMAGQNYFWQFTGNNNTVRIEDSQVANAGRHTSLVNQRFLDTRGLDTDSLIVINTSLYNIGHHIIRTVGSFVNYVYIDHMTVANAIQTTFDLHLTREITIKNSLFQNTGVEGRWESAEVAGEAGAAYDGEPYFTQGGWIYITSYDRHYEAVEDGPRDTERKVVIKNNNFGGLPSQEYLDNWALFNVLDPENNPINTGGRGSRPWGTDPAWRAANPTITPEDPEWATRDTIPLIRVLANPMDSILRSWATQKVAWATIENNIRENVSIPDMPASMAAYVKATWYNTPDIPNHYDYWTEISADPTTRYFHPGPGTPVATTGSTASWFRNFAYNDDSQSFTHAENSYPVGSLVYFPELRERWGRGLDITNVREPLQASESFRIVGNFPNPFSQHTDIVFQLQSDANVTLAVFNVLGHRVVDMPLGPQNAGEHRIQLDASQLAKGMYFLRMQAGNEVQTHSMTLLR